MRAFISCFLFVLLPLEALEAKEGASLQVLEEARVRLPGVWTFEEENAFAYSYFHTSEVKGGGGIQISIFKEETQESQKLSESLASQAKVGVKEMCKGVDLDKINILKNKKRSLYHYKLLVSECSSDFNFDRFDLILFWENQKPVIVFSLGNQENFDFAVKSANQLESLDIKKAKVSISKQKTIKMMKSIHLIRKENWILFKKIDKHLVFHKSFDDNVVQVIVVPNYPITKGENHDEFTDGLVLGMKGKCPEARVLEKKTISVFDIKNKKYEADSFLVGAGESCANFSIMAVLILDLRQTMLFTTEGNHKDLIVPDHLAKAISDFDLSEVVYDREEIARVAEVIYIFKFIGLFPKAAKELSSARGKSNEGFNTGVAVGGIFWHIVANFVALFFFFSILKIFIRDGWWLSFFFMTPFLFLITWVFINPLVGSIVMFFYRRKITPKAVP